MMMMVMMMMMIIRTKLSIIMAADSHTVKKVYTKRYSKLQNV